MPRFEAQIIKNTVTPKLNKELYEPEAETIAKAWLGDDVLPEARRRAPKDTEGLARSLKVYTSRTVSGIKSDSRKAPFVHGRFSYPAAPATGKRTRPHFPPPNQSLRNWAGRHGIPLFMVQKAIARRGTPIVPFLDEAVQEKLPKLASRIQEAARRIERKWRA